MLVNFVKNSLNFQPEHTIKNRNQLITEINITLPCTFKILSFDITNLYTNIPIMETLKILKELIQNNLSNKKDTENIITLFKQCFKQNFCQFDDYIYKYNDGNGITTQ